MVGNPVAPWNCPPGLRASLDLHTGPGSQNGYDNSGRRGEIRWVEGAYPLERANVERTLDIVDMMSETLSSWMEEVTLPTSC